MNEISKKGGWDMKSVGTMKLKNREYPENPKSFYQGNSFSRTGIRTQIRSCLHNYALAN